MTSASCLLTEMSTSERARAAADPDAVVILPIGATEQHGPHLPVGTDSLIAQILLQAVIDQRKETDVFCIAPLLSVSKSTEHLDFSGTLSLDRELFSASVTSMLEQLRIWGFGRIALLNTHGGNDPVLRTLVREALARGETDLLLLEVEPDLSACSKRERIYGIHAGEYETSLLLARGPELCRPDLADCVWIDECLPHPDLQPENAPATFSWISSDLTASGTMGDATQATAEKGEYWISQVADQILNQLRTV